MKDKRRNTDKRKEKSRDAARCRRSKESEVFFELADSLPLPPSLTAQLDKASVMRLAISVLKLCKVLEQHSWSDAEKEGGSKGEVKCRDDQLFPKALDGFVFILSNDGDIVYISESVAKYLGVQQIELMGQSIFEFTHPRDEDEIQEVLSSRVHGSKAAGGGMREERMFFLRMKCTLTAKGRNVNLKSASYKVIKCTGRLVLRGGRGSGEEGGGGMAPYLMAIGEPIPHPANIQIPMDQKTFLSKHDMNMRFTYCDERVKDLVGYDGEDLEGKSVYDYHHAMDSEIVEKAYKDLLGRGKGQMMTGQYRFLAQGGGWVWVVTQATVIYNSRNQKAQWVVCVHYVLSEVEEKDLVLSEVQVAVPRAGSPTLLNMESFFSPNTNDDTSLGYFIPAEMRDKIKLTKNNEPEDLSFLAPSAGERSMPLHFPSFAAVHDMAIAAEEEMLNRAPNKPDIVCPLAVSPMPQFSVSLVGQEERSLSSPPVLLTTVELKKEPPPTLSPPAASLCPPRDLARCPTVPSPASSTPSAASSRMSSPYDYRKAASPNDILSMDRFFQDMGTKAEDVVDKDSEMVDVNHRAPYIPMTGKEDLSLLPPSSDSLLTLQNDVDPGLFGKTEFVFKPKREDIFEDAPPTPPRQSVRDMVGGSTAVASIEQPPDTMFQQIKRPLDMNSLEKGPPPAKVQRTLGLGRPHIQHSGPALKGAKDSVLLNLLLTGEDPNGYKVLSPSPTPTTAAVTTPLKKNIPSKAIQAQLLRLTTRDCEVNAPTQSTGLLQGSELLKALEIGVPPTPR